MAPQSTLISALTPSLGKSATMQLRATRIWEAFQRQPRKLLHTKVVFVDEQGSQIMLTVWNNQKDDYFPLIKEGGVYNVSDVRVVGNSKDYRAVNRDLALNFYHRTKVVPAADTERIPQYAFDLTKFEDVPTLLRATKCFIEVIGMVRDYKDPEPASNGAKKMEILLVDNRLKEMVVTLWEEKAIRFQEGLAGLGGEPAFVVITGLLAKKYSANDIILSSGDATKSYFNIDYNPLKELKATILATTAEKGCVMLLPTKKHFVTTEANRLAEVKVQEILDIQISNPKEVLRFLCEATIVDVSKYDGWYYDACQKCPKKIRVDNGKFYCDSCEVETHGYKLRYRITVGVKDDSGKATFTLINNDAERLIGVPIETIVSDIGQENLTETIPPVISNVIGKKCAFEVKVTSYNQDGRGGYTVARLSQLATCAASATGSTTTMGADTSSTTTMGAGPNKRAKLA